MNQSINQDNILLYCILIIIAVTRDLSLHGFFKRNTLFSRLVRQAKGTCTEDLVQSGPQGTLPTMTVNNLFENSPSTVSVTLVTIL